MATVSSGWENYSTWTDFTISNKTRFAMTSKWSNPVITDRQLRVTIMCSIVTLIHI